MLDEIRAHNVGLIDDAVLTPGMGLTVITGETGTGKTLMLGALRLVTGSHASKGIIGPHAANAEVAARFINDAGEELIVRRVVTDGRSRAYLNGVPATAAQVVASAGPLVSIVGQHDQHTLSTSDGVRRLIDAMFTPLQNGTLSAYRDAYESIHRIEAEMDAVGDDTRGLERELEMTRFQIAEIIEAGFNVGDEEELRTSLGRLRHAEEISTDLSVVSDSIGETGIGDALGIALTALDRIDRLDPGAGQLRDRLTAVATDINEMATDVARYAETIEADPHILAKDEQRLSELSSLKRKYGDTISDVNAFAKAAQQRVETIGALLDAAETLEERHRKATDTLTATARQLTDIRAMLASDASRVAEEHLKDLGFSHPVVEIVIDSKAPGATGADRLSVLFASDNSLERAPIALSASGGELSRLVLALTLACGVADTDLVAFDEIDAGVGGSTALAMGEKLASLATTRQVICVTHLPQVAAHGDHHFTVERRGTTATITQLDPRSRTGEISRMLAGLEGSRTAIQHAEELLERAAQMRHQKGDV